MGDITKDVHDPEEDEAEEALSLCDFPIDKDDTSCFKEFTQSDRRSSSEPPDFFEFLGDLSSEMCPADDIIFCGKLVPFKHPSPTPTHNNTTATTTTTTTTKDHQKHTAFRRRSESLSEAQTPRSNSTKNRLMRSSRSLDYRKLHRSSSSEPESDRNLSGKSFGKADISTPKVPKSPWYLLMFGMVKLPPEMELRDIKNRQVRQNPASLIPAVESGRKAAVNRSGGKGGSWGLLKVLSCKDPASVAVTASFGCIPQV
ncbi:hypothetical protein L1049_021871 [Liquidambar formosana]|uniref:Uncharacterized protein n=1 Tax=Liquidambar formosana TaxID=63359 RepID=A0AAP0RD29_LIQFO